MRSQTFTYIISYGEGFLESSSTFNNIQIVLNLVPLRKSQAQNVQTGYQGNLRKTGHVENIMSGIQLYNKMYHEKLDFCEIS